MYLFPEKGENDNLYEEYVCGEDLDDTEDTNGNVTETTFTDNTLRNVVKELCRNETNYAER